MNKAFLATSALIIALSAFLGVQAQKSQNYASEGQLGATVLKVPNGGTGASTFASGECLVGNGTGAVTTQACGAGGGTNDWQFTFASQAITPTSSVGLFINASSTINANFRVSGNATTTGSQYVASLNLNGVERSTWPSSGSGANDWQFGGATYIKPTTTVGVIVSASSTISRLTTDFSTTSQRLVVTETNPASNNGLLYVGGDIVAQSNFLFEDLSLDSLGYINFQGINSTNGLVNFARIAGSVRSSTAGSEYGQLVFQGYDGTTDTLRTFLTSTSSNGSYSGLIVGDAQDFAVIMPAAAGFANQLRIYNETKDADIILYAKDDTNFPSSIGMDVGVGGRYVFDGVSGNVFHADISHATITPSLLLGSTNGLSERMASGDLYVGDDATITDSLHVGSLFQIKDSTASTTGSFVVGTGLGTIRTLIGSGDIFASRHATITSNFSVNTWFTVVDNIFTVNNLSKFSDLRLANGGNASSTFNFFDIRAYNNATVTNSFAVGSLFNARDSYASTTGYFVVGTKKGSFTPAAGDLHVSGNATTVGTSTAGLFRMPNGRCIYEDTTTTTPNITIGICPNP